MHGAIPPRPIRLKGNSSHLLRVRENFRFAILTLVTAKVAGYCRMTQHRLLEIVVSEEPAALLIG
jgi:hypothetical protein